jgi:glucokinase
VGCLETYVSARGVVRTAFEFMAKYNDSSPLRDFPFSKLDSRVIFELAKNGDRLSKNIFEFTGRILGEKLAEVVTLIEPEKIILAGGLAEAGEFLLPFVHEFLENNLIVTLKNRVVIEVSELGMNKAALLGAASIIFNTSHLSPYKNNLKVNLP